MVLPVTMGGGAALSLFGAVCVGLPGPLGCPVDIQERVQIMILVELGASLLITGGTPLFSCSRFCGSLDHTDFRIKGLLFCHNSES